MKFKQRYHLIFLFPFFLSMLFSCESLEKDVELPLPEVYLTSTLTDISQTKIKIKGERTGVRKNDTDLFGVVYSEKTAPTLIDSKLNVTNNDGVFEVTAERLKPNTTYYFRAFLQTKDKIYYSNQLESNGTYDNRWERKEDMSEKFKYFTGVLFFSVFKNLTLINAEDDNTNKATTAVYFPEFIGNNPTGRNIWYVDPIRMQVGIREMLIINPSPDRTFIGGGFTINDNLPSTKIYSNRLFFYGDKDDFGGEQTVPMPCEGEALGFNIGKGLFLLETRNDGRLWDFTNLEWIQKENHTFKNLGRIIIVGNDQRGYLISESTSPSTKGCVLYEYNPTAQTWITKKAFTGEERNQGIVFSVKNKIYYGLGRSKRTKRILQDIWEYDPQKDNWKQIGFYPGNGNIALIQTVVGNEVYLGMGYQTFINDNSGLEFSGVRDFWIFRP